MDINVHCGGKMYINVPCEGQCILLFTGGGKGKLTFTDDKNEHCGSQEREIGQ